ncbi:hypothetical protein Syun_029571 [Stephania yunnanensis]|uniref:Uncharacterized protein n=1 Tax=Stephania yunnanensis TaxID=152371 RepID=A0AAP0HJM0_9MAGN
MQSNPDKEIYHKKKVAHYDDLSIIIGNEQATRERGMTGNEVSVDMSGFDEIGDMREIRLEDLMEDNVNIRSDSTQSDSTRNTPMTRKKRKREFDEMDKSIKGAAVAATNLAVAFACTDCMRICVELEKVPGLGIDDFMSDPLENLRLAGVPLALFYEIPTSNLTASREATDGKDSYATLVLGNWNYYDAIRSEKRGPKLEATHLEKANELYTKCETIYMSSHSADDFRVVLHSSTTRIGQFTQVGTSIVVEGVIEKSEQRNQVIELKVEKIVHLGFVDHDRFLPPLETVVEEKFYGLDWCRRSVSFQFLPSLIDVFFVPMKLDLVLVFLVSSYFVVSSLVMMMMRKLEFLRSTIVTIDQVVVVRVLFSYCCHYIFAKWGVLVFFI